MIEIIKEKKPKYLFLDCFDTLLHRDINCEDLLLQWSSLIVKRFHLGYSALEIYNLRLKVFSDMVSMYNDPSLEQVCSKIYCILSNEEEININKMDFVSYCISAEIELEINGMYVEEQIVPLLEYAKKNNIRCYVVSDFYMGKNVIEKYLEKLDIIKYFSGIYISCDCNCRKDSSGELYKYVCADLGIEPANTIMIGDNIVSDIVNAKKNGIYGVWNGYKVQSISHGEKWVRHQLETVYENSIRHEPLSIYGFTCYLFIDRLCKYLLTMNISKVYFFSREGQFLKKLFDTYVRRQNILINSEYMYVSRLSTYKAALKKLEDEDFHVLKRQYQNLSMNSFLYNIGMENYCLENNMSLEVVPDFFNSSQFKNLLSDENFVKEYNDCRQYEKNNFVEYLKSIGINNGDTCCFVDIGWKGTIQDNISIILDKSDIIGFYMGLSDVGDANARNKKRGILFEKYPKKTHLYGLWSMLDLYCFENLIQADHSQTVGYLKMNEVVSPVLASCGKNPKYIAAEKILDNVEMVFNCLNDLFIATYIKPNDVIDFFERAQCDLVFKYDSSKLKSLNSVNSVEDSDSFGQFKKFKKYGFYEIMRAIKHCGLFSKEVIDCMLMSRTWLIVPYSVFGARYFTRKRYEE